MTESTISREEMYQTARDRLNSAAYGELLEAITSAIYTAKIREGDIVVDCGANWGRHTIGMANLVGETGRVHSFEISPIVIPWFKEQIAAAGAGPRVVLHEVALAKEPGTVTFHYTEGGGHGMSGLKPRRLTEEQAKTIRYVPTTVRAARLDDEVPESHQVTFIKLDLEGGEFGALLGAQRILKTHRPVVVFENGRAESAEDYGYTAEQFFSVFSSVRYAIFDAFGYPFVFGDWQRSGIPWQFIALPEELPLGKEYK